MPYADLIQRRAYHNQYTKNKRANESPEQREARLQKARARNRRQYASDPAHRERVLSYNRSYRKANPERPREWDRRKRLKHGGKIRQRYRNWVVANRDRVLRYTRLYYRANAKRIGRINRESNQRRYAILDAADPGRVIARKLRWFVHGRLNAGKANKKLDKLVNLVGCDVQALRRHIEAQFQPGMSWDNYGLKTWHIDHIRPVASFDMTDVGQQRQCFHYSNLQPLWAIDNCRKGAKYTPTVDPTNG